MPRAPPAASRRWAFGEDDSVALMLRNDFATFEVNMAAGQLGAYAVPINWHFTPEEAGYILADSGAKVLVAHSDLLAQIASGVPAGVKVLVVPTPEEIAAAYGVPAEKRRAPRGRRDLGWLRGRSAAQHPAAQAGARQHDLHVGHDRPAQGRAAPALDARAAGSWPPARRPSTGASSPIPSIVVLMNGPMYHSAPAAYGMGSARLGLHMVLQPRFEAEDMLRLIDRHKVSHMHIVPTMFVRLLRLPDEVKRRYDLSSLRWVTHGAAPCAPGGEAPDDRVVGTGHQRVLRRHRDRHRGVARFAGGAAPSPARWATSSTAPRCASSTSRAMT